MEQQPICKEAPEKVALCEPGGLLDGCVANDSDGLRQGKPHAGMFDGMFNQISQTQRARSLLPIHGWCLTTSQTLKKMLQLGRERLNRSRADLFDKTVIAIQQLTVIG